MKMTFLSASDLARRCNAPNSRLLRKIHRGEIIADANVNGTLLFNESRIAEVSQILSRKD